MHRSVHIVYLGRKGAGLNFTYSLFDELCKNNIEVASLILNSNNLGAREQKQANINCINFSRIFIISFLQSLTFALRFLDSINSKATPVIIFPMSSPLDIFLSILLKLKNIPNIRVIHDVKSHLGESWPDPLSNRILIGTATELVTLSRYEQDRMLEFYKRTSIRVQHPIFHAPVDFKPNLIEVERIVLFVGRIREYKGIPTLLRAWEGLQKTGYSLRICGQGKMPPLDSLEGLEVKNCWLTEHELHSEISRAEIIVFPYLEASQSGVIPIAISKRKKIVVTPVGGLIEQITDYEDAFVSLDTSVESLRFALAAAINGKSNLGNKTQGNAKDSISFLPLVNYLKKS